MADHIQQILAGQTRRNFTSLICRDRITRCIRWADRSRARDAAKFHSRLFFCALEVRNAARSGVRGRTEVKNGDNLDEQLKQNGNGVAAATIARPVATYGEQFADGSSIELIGGVHGENPQLMLWDRLKETIGATVEHHGQLYEPAPINTSVLQALIFPNRCCPHESTREFLAETCKLIANYAGLPEKFASLVGRVTLCSALAEAVSVAPTLEIVGPGIARGNRLMELLRCI